MKEPVDARECVEHLGFTLEPSGVKPLEVEVKENTDTSKMNKGQLVELAKDNNIELDGSETKAEIIEKIEAKD